MGATKLSGRTDGGLSFGVLAAATGADFNPDRFYGTTRFRQEVGRDSYVGGLVTYYNRTSLDVGLTSVSGGAQSH